jgi:hypothetical protein
MKRKPLPDDVNFVVQTADEVRTLLATAGVPRHASANLNFDQLHALLTRHVSPGERDLARLIVIVNETGAHQLNSAMAYAVTRLRPDIADPGGYDTICPRRKAHEKIDGMSAGLGLRDLEAAILAQTEQVNVVLEDRDYDNVMAAMNEILSGMPHGRSPDFD